MLVLLEAKHRVVFQHLDKEGSKHSPGLKQRLDKFCKFLDSLGGMLPPSTNKKVILQRNTYKDHVGRQVLGAIGGEHFESSLQTKAKRLNFLTVTTDGSRYSVQ